MTLYFLYFLGNINVFIVQPIVNLKVNTSDYECSVNMQHFLWIVDDIYVAVIPLAFQVIFLAVMWRLANIQDDGESLESLTQHFKGDGISSMRMSDVNDTESVGSAEFGERDRNVRPVTVRRNDLISAVTRYKRDLNQYRLSSSFDAIRESEHPYHEAERHNNPLACIVRFEILDR